MREVWTANRGLRIVASWIAMAVFAVAQELPTPTPSVISEESPSLSSSPEKSVTPSPASEQPPSALPTRNARINFVPPPLEGTISLGIYDGNGKLVRVLHQEAELNEFTIGADALLTQWDGKNDDGEDVSAGKYHARGYLVGHLRVEDLGQSAAPPPENNATVSVKVKLLPNPLASDKQSIIDLGVGFDRDGSYLKTIDNLPLLTVSETPNLVRVLIAKKSGKSIDVWLDDGTALHQFRISGVDKMMAFDCGDLELK
jgi:hypothetical protein